jgi:hypothetical protein
MIPHQLSATHFKQNVRQLQETSVPWLGTCVEDGIASNPAVTQTGAQGCTDTRFAASRVPGPASEGPRTGVDLHEG